MLQEVKNKIQNMDESINNINMSIVKISENIKSILEKLNALPCVSHSDKIVSLEKKISNWSMVWATILGGVTLFGIIIGVTVQIIGAIK